MNRYALELRNAWGRKLWCVLDTMDNFRVVARCDLFTDAEEIRQALCARAA